MDASSRPSPYRVVAFAFALGVGLWLLPRLVTPLLCVFGAVVFGLLLDQPVSALTRRRVPRGLATGLVVAVGFAVVAGAAVVLVPTVSAQFRALSAEHGDLGAALGARANMLLARHGLPELDPQRMRLDTLAARLDGLRLLRSTGETVTTLLVSLFAATWAVANPDPLIARILGFVPPARRGRVRAVAGTVERRLRGWLAGQLTLCCAVGAASYLLLRVLGVPFAALFAVGFGVAEAVPTLGILVASAGPVAITALDEPHRVVALLVGIVAIQQAEDRLLVPVVMGRAVDIPQSILVLALFAFGTLGGPVGMAVAVPVVATVFAVHDELVGYDLPAAAGDVGRGSVDGPHG